MTAYNDQQALIARLSVWRAGSYTSADQTKSLLNRVTEGQAIPPALVRTLAITQMLSSQPLYAGNHAEVLVDGADTYDAMHEAIVTANDHVHLQTYILAKDAVGWRLVESLCQTARRGVQVRVVLDGMGSRAARGEMMDALARAGVAVRVFHPLSITGIGKLWFRDHRKLLLVDGSVAFTGGINFALSYASRRRSRFSPRRALERGWRDTHARIRGPGVQGFQRLFAERWQGLGGATLHVVQADAEEGSDLVRPIASQSRDGTDSEIVQALLPAIRLAVQRVWITQAYFAPPRTVIEALCEAAEKGVDVRLLLPARSDFLPVQVAARSHYRRLLVAGVRIFEYQAEVLHAKTVLVDDAWATIGSCNLDWRSLKYNDELNAEIISRSFVAQLARVFENDLESATAIELPRWRRRGWHRRAGEWAARRLQRLW